MTEKTSTTATRDHAQVFTGQWPSIVQSVSEAFRMDAEEQAWLENKKIAQLIGSIPFLAGCEQPARTAIAHVGTYLLSIKETKPYFNADPSDDIDMLERLRLIMNFRGGDERIIARGMSLIGLIMLEDYKRDIHIDEVLGKYNPVASGAIDYDGTKVRLLSAIRAVDCPAMDRIFAEDGPVGPDGFWGK